MPPCPLAYRAEFSGNTIYSKIARKCSSPPPNRYKLSIAVKNEYSENCENSYSSRLIIMYSISRKASCKYSFARGL